MQESHLTDLQLLLIKHECEHGQLSRSLKPIYDTANPPRLTIGVGRNLDDKGISEDEAIMLLNRDIADAIHDAQSVCSVYELLSRPRQMVMVSLAFNLGRHRLGKFVRFLDALHRGEYDEAADEMLDSTWATQVGQRAVELATMMRNTPQATA